MQVLNIFTPGSLDVADSYGLLTCQLARYLTRAGVYVNLFSLGQRQAGPAHDAELSDIIARPIRAAVGGVFLGYPTTFAQHPNPLSRLGPRVGVTMFESTKIPVGWSEALNACDAVITPSTFCRDIFQDAGVTSPLTVAPLGINPVYKFVKRSADRPFTFLAFIDRGMRKGGIQAMQAFLEAFGDDENYHLILKGRTSKINAEVLNPNVTLIQRDMSEDELYQLYLSADCMIFATKGEGFGLPCREFAATGGIALTTNWSGTADHIVQWGVPLSYKLVPADWSNHGRLASQDLGYWAEVDQKQLVQKLRWVAAYRDWHRAMANVYSVNIERLYTWEGFAKTVLETWEGVANGHSRAA